MKRKVFGCWLKVVLAGIEFQIDEAATECKPGMPTLVLGTTGLGAADDYSSLSLYRCLYQQQIAENI